MTRETSADRIIHALQRFPGSDDDELARIAGVQPRQQVNQICRWLESKGVIRRAVGRRNKIVNYLTDSTVARRRSDRVATDVQVHARRGNLSRQLAAADGSTASVGSSCIPTALPDLRSTLILVPCSGAKVQRLDRRWGLRDQSITDGLSANLTRRLGEARQAVAAKARLDESDLMPACQRYDGSLYKAARREISGALANGGAPHVLIVSGGYGLVHAAEPIGRYNAMFRRRDWPEGLLEEVLMSYVKHHNLHSVRAFASSTTEYGRLIRNVAWPRAGVEDGWLLMPEPVPGGLVKSPRAQGEALCALFRGELTEAWRSSDELSLSAIALSHP